VRCFVYDLAVTIPPSCGILHGAPVGDFHALNYVKSA
jgi:hypothetical protein